VHSLKQNKECRKHFWKKETKPMTSAIFDKTDKGREEIATRKYQLASRLRTLLVLVDGKQSTADLLKKVSGLGLNEESMAELLNGGFIQNLTIFTATAVADANPVAVSLELTLTEDILPPGESQFTAIYHFYTETIRSMIGLRGYTLQLKVEKAASIDDFRNLRQPYLDAVLKAKGNEIARSLGSRLDQLLYLGESGPPNTTIIGRDATSSE
jgi:hypothetical protein